MAIPPEREQTDHSRDGDRPSPPDPGTDDDARQRWNQRYAEEGAPLGPSIFLVEQAHLLPVRGRALDLAGGAGRNTLWLAARGLAVTLVDVSDEACAIAARRAAEAGADVEVRRLDLDTSPLPEGDWDVIVVTHYLDRGLWADLPGRLAPGGVLLVCQATASNLERHDRPPRPWLLDDGEMARLARAMAEARPDLEVVDLAEGWSAEGRHEARLVVRRA